MISEAWKKDWLSDWIMFIQYALFHNILMTFFFIVTNYCNQNQYAWCWKTFNVVKISINRQLKLWKEMATNISLKKSKLKLNYLTWAVVLSIISCPSVSLVYLCGEKLRVKKLCCRKMTFHFLLVGAFILCCQVLCDIFVFLSAGNHDQLALF